MCVCACVCVCVCACVRVCVCVCVSCGRDEQRRGESLCAEHVTHEVVILWHEGKYAEAVGADKRVRAATKAGKGFSLVEHVTVTIPIGTGKPPLRPSQVTSSGFSHVSITILKHAPPSTWCPSTSKTHICTLAATFSTPAS